MVVALVTARRAAQPPIRRRRDVGLHRQGHPDRSRSTTARPIDPPDRQDELRRRGSEHYERGETLYLQGDYDGAVQELVARVLPVAVLLRSSRTSARRTSAARVREGDRLLRALRARDARAMPGRATVRARSAGRQGERDRARIHVLEKLQAQICVETDARRRADHDRQRDGARGGDDARASAIDVLGGRYEMTIEHDGYEPVTTRDRRARSASRTRSTSTLEPQRGQLRVHVAPSDARLFVDDRQVGIGRYDDDARRRPVHDQRGGAGPPDRHARRSRSCRTATPRAASSCPRIRRSAGGS